MVRWFENTVQHFCLAAVAGFRGNVDEHFEHQNQRLFSEVV